MFNHQLYYNAELFAFISNAKRTLQKKWDEVWGHICKLADIAGVPHDTCLSLALQVLDKLPTVSIDLSYCMLIPMMLAYGPESYAYQTWHEDSALSGEASTSMVLTGQPYWPTLPVQQCTTP